VSDLEHALAAIVDRPRGGELVRALALLAEDRPEAFDSLVPTIVPLVMGAAGQGA
jgi:hypothetical protein